jgi:hypothetical protein
MNIVITKSLGDAIFKLKGGERIQRIKRGRWASYYLWAPVAGGENSIRVSDDLVKQLEKLKLVDGRAVDHRVRYWRGARREYVANDACKNFRLPPEEFWVPDGPV